MKVSINSNTVAKSKKICYTERVHKTTRRFEYERFVSELRGGGNLSTTPSFWGILAQQKMFFAKCRSALLCRHENVLRDFEISLKSKTSPQPTLGEGGQSLEKVRVINSCVSTVKSLFTSKKAAFTLAEVLITLGIIGVVAAMTLPSLIGNYTKQVYVNQLKKSYSVMSQGFNKMMADDGVTRIEDTEFFNSAMINPDLNSYGSTTFDFSKLDEIMKKYFYVVKICDNTEWLADGGYTMKEQNMYFPFGNGDNKVRYYFLKDGSIFQLSPGSNHSSYDDDGPGGAAYFDINVDINGLKKPNEPGRDIFKFVMTGKSKILPWVMSVDEPGCNVQNAWTMTSCAYRIITRDGWKMNY